jgi:DNA uptake protein ComE-like DNA-binding protein
MSSQSTFFLLALVAALLGGNASQAAGDKPAGSVSAASQAKASSAPAKLIDSNSASRAQLKTLPGIGDAEADRIIAARPYPSKAKLGAERVVSGETYLAIKGLIVAVQPEAPEPKIDRKASAKP